jgi:hypothetical protein
MKYCYGIMARTASSGAYPGSVAPKRFHPTFVNAAARHPHVDQRANAAFAQTPFGRVRLGLDLHTHPPVPHDAVVLELGNDDFYGVGGEQR